MEEPKHALSCTQVVAHTWAWAGGRSTIDTRTNYIFEVDTAFGPPLPRAGYGPGLHNYTDIVDTAFMY